MGAVDTETPAGRRAQLEQRIVGDLLGPADGEDELVAEGTVRSRYLVGLLAPSDTTSFSPDADEEGPSDAFGESVDDDRDGRRASKPVLFPSSMGVSFAVEADVAELSVAASWGMYVKEAGQVEDGDAAGRRAWRRHPQEHLLNVALPTDVEGKLGPFPLGTALPGGEPGSLGQVEVSGRAWKHGDCWLVTLFLSNEQQPLRQNRDSAWLFQPKLQVTAAGGAPVFVGRGEALPGQRLSGSDSDEQALLDVQYRNVVEFAVGHGCATASQPAVGNPQRAVRVETEFLPRSEVLKTVPASTDDTPELAGVVLDMRDLAQAADPDQVRAWLLPLADGYQSWLEQRRAELDEGELGDLLPYAEFAVDDAVDVATKVKEGVDAICGDEDALAAFRFANEVMWKQRIHTVAVERARSQPELDVDTLVDATADGTVDLEKNRRWRPFQLAFLLLNVPEMVNPTHQDRSSTDAKVDLLFFPTGGGKTEAYLGLTAFTFAMRRLRRDTYALDGSDGVTVLMRYTLRLLTAQQFERAAAMVCAAELVRRGDSGTWGEVPFRLGMWVGGSVTPNRTDEARDIIERARQSGSDRKAGQSPLQLSACPWCGEKLKMSLGKDCMETHKENPWRRTLLFCPNVFCAFSKGNAPGEGIPVVTVDEEVYRLLPTFLIGTVDKFAQVPWNGATRQLFGRTMERCDRHGWRNNDVAEMAKGQDGSHYCEPDAKYHQAGEGRPKDLVHHDVGRLRPPDLIIQDEFHLITGPLGSLAGLYETVLDEACHWDMNSNGGPVSVRPKVIASTATIRRADQQTRAVFDRQVRMFPPQVTDVADTFFARQVPADVAPGRRYLGVCAPGRRMKEVEKRVFQTVMAAGQDLWDEDGEGHGLAADPWMTTVGYFSAIRELAGLRRIAGDEIRSSLYRIKPERRPGLRPRGYPNLQELTSRVSSSDIRGMLDWLAVRHDPDRDPKSQKPIDLLLATSMISVGVDVSRLGLMVMVGQPKADEEYIQASSRVGRSDAGPGLVVTIYNWARPRDVSHYEQFEHYHASFYRHVNALSVTPFADRALERGLSAVLIGLARTIIDEYATNHDASKVQRSNPELQHLCDRVVARAARVVGSADIEAKVRAAIDERLDALERERTTKKGALAYRKTGQGKSQAEPLLHQTDERVTDPAQQLWMLPNSLRNTEPTVNLLHADWTDAEAGAPAWKFPAGPAPEPTGDHDPDTDDAPTVPETPDEEDVA